LGFFILSITLAAGLMLVTISLQGLHNPSAASFGSTLRNNLARLNQGLRAELLAAANATNHVGNAVGRATNVHALIRPADYVPTPVITPSAAPAITTATASPVPTQSVVNAQSAAVPVTTTPTHAGNGYAWGNCTWWVAIRRAQIGAAIPNNWGNAATWAARAARDGYRVDHTPVPGAIMQTARAAGGLGHAALVEQVDSDGTWHISEMNVLGLNIVDHAARSASAAASYNFIH
jgi:surface antigen